jgi:hypothetical protein
MMAIGMSGYVLWRTYTLEQEEGIFLRPDWTRAYPRFLE